MFLKNAYLTLLFFIFICGLIYICTTPTKRQSNQTSEQIQSSHYIPSKPRVELTGFQYDLNFKGKKSFELKADRFLIRKRKIGLFRFGLAEEALFQNTQVSFFCTKKLVPLHNKSNGLITCSFKLQDANTSETENNNTLSSLNEILSPLATKRLSSVFMAPINIVFYNENTKVSHIYAKNASLDLRRKEFILSGDVWMTAGEKQIKTNKLLFLPETEEIYIPSKFMFEINGVETKSEPIISDILLNAISL